MVVVVVLAVDTTGLAVVVLVELVGLVVVGTTAYSAVAEAVGLGVDWVEVAELVASGLVAAGLAVGGLVVAGLVVVVEEVALADAMSVVGSETEPVALVVEYGVDTFQFVVELAVPVDLLDVGYFVLAVDTIVDLPEQVVVVCHEFGLVDIGVLAFEQVLDSNFAADFAG